MVRRNAPAVYDHPEFVTTKLAEVKKMEWYANAGGKTYVAFCPSMSFPSPILPSSA
jgi:hypothetical protein